MVNPALAKVGVEAVVMGLGTFLGNISKVDSAIKSLAPTSTMLGRAFSGMGDIVSGLLGGVFRTLEYTLGTLLADAIKAVARSLKELVSGAIEAGDEFARFDIRLKRLNFNDLRESGMDYTDAMGKAVEMTKEQVEWATRLSLQTPFDPKDYINIFTLAKSYGFAADEAKNLTGAVMEFTAGMGLTNVEAERIVINFGQMRQQGKLNGQDLKDLGRGAFVPVNRLLAETATLLGYNAEEFKKLRASGELGAEGVDAFVKSFISMAEQDFAGAGRDLGQVFSAAQKNLKGLVESMLGMKIVRPVLLMIGEYLFSFTGALAASEENWNRLKGSLERISEVVLRVIASFMMLLPTSEEMATNVLDSLDGVADWFEAHESDMVNWVKEASKWINETLVPAIANLWTYLFGDEDQPGAIKNFGDWLRDEFIPRVIEVSQWVGNVLVPFLRDDLVPVFEALVPLGEAVADVLIAVLGGEKDSSLSDMIHDKIIPALEGLAVWVAENRDLLAGLLKAFLALQVILFLVSVVFSIISAITALIAKVVTTTVVLAAIAVIIGVVIAAWKLFQHNITVIGEVIAAVIWHLFRRFMEFKDNLSRTFNEVVAAIRNKDWAGAGKAVIDGVWRGIQNNYWQILDLMRTIATKALASFKGVFGIKSPSVVMEIVGENIVKGLSEGIANSASMAIKSMRTMASSVMMPAIQQAQIAMSAMPANSVTHNTTNAYNLSINTNAPTENVIQDFNMMESLS